MDKKSSLHGVPAFHFTGQLSTFGADTSLSHTPLMATTVTSDRPQICQNHWKTLKKYPFLDLQKPNRQGRGELLKAKRVESGEPWEEWDKISFES